MSKDGRGVGGWFRFRSSFYRWRICHRTGNDSDSVEMSSTWSNWMAWTIVSMILIVGLGEPVLAWSVLTSYWFSNGNRRN